jgi:hypothetical protein
MLSIKLLNDRLAFPFGDYKESGVCHKATLFRWHNATGALI